MSRIGKREVKIPQGAKITVQGSECLIEGPKGKLTVAIPEYIQVKVGEKSVAFDRSLDTKTARSFHGLVRNLVNNAFIGVTQGYKKTLDIHGVGFKAQLKGNILNCALGYSHEINYSIPEGVTVTVPQQTHIIVESTDKVKVGQVASQIRNFYQPEPYKGKGVRYSDEQIRRKQGKVVG
jgi:large subunit ribosomal protein L6